MQGDTRNSYAAKRRKRNHAIAQLKEIEKKKLLNSLITIHHLSQGSVPLPLLRVWVVDVFVDASASLVKVPPNHWRLWFSSAAENSLSRCSAVWFA